MNEIETALKSRLENVWAQFPPGKIVMSHKTFHPNSRPDQDDRYEYGVRGSLVFAEPLEKFGQQDCGVSRRPDRDEIWLHDDFTLHIYHRSESDSVWADSWSGMDREYLRPATIDDLDDVDIDVIESFIAKHIKRTEKRIMELREKHQRISGLASALKTLQVGNYAN